MVMLIGFQIAVAEEGSGPVIYNTRLVTNDKDATFIEGEVPIASGQTVVLRTGFRVIAEKKMPNTGMRAKFKIKVPAKKVKDDKVSVLFVEERKNGDAISKAERVELEYVERQKQKITTESKEYSLTYPGLDTAINAEATSGEKLIYTSSDPDIVDVDRDGNITANGEGEAEITVKQIGSSAYEEAEETVSVSVEQIDAYSVTFHSSDENEEEGKEEETHKQIINDGEEVNLEDNIFENEDHEFLGWATDDEGLMEYLDTAEVKDLASTGENVDLYAVWSGDGARAAVAWAEKIAADDSFSYGKKPQTNKVGCYFCGTNQKRKPKGYEKTYVCMTFAHAAYAHGAEDPELYKDCSTGRHCITETNTNLTRYSCFRKVGLAKNLSVSDLEPGDIIIYYSANNYSGHVAMYAGDNTIVDAEGIKDCWGPNSIAVRPGRAASMLRGAAKHSSKSYVMRYVGPNA